MEVKEKGVGDLVSVVDMKAELAILQGAAHLCDVCDHHPLTYSRSGAVLRSEFPDDLILSEETEQSTRPVNASERGGRD